MRALEDYEATALRANLAPRRAANADSGRGCRHSGRRWPGRAGFSFPLSPGPPLGPLPPFIPCPLLSTHRPVASSLRPGVCSARRGGVLPQTGAWRGPGAGIHSPGRPDPNQIGSIYGLAQAGSLTQAQNLGPGAGLTEQILED